MVASLLIEDDCNLVLCLFMLCHLLTLHSNSPSEVIFLSRGIPRPYWRCCLVTKLWPHELQHARLPCPSLSPRVCSDSCLLSCWLLSNHLTVAPFSSCSQSFPAPESFPVSQLFASGGQSTGASASGSVLPMNNQGWFPLGLTGLISLLSKGLYHQESSPAPQFKSINSLVLSCLYSPPPTTVHDYWKNHSFHKTDLCQQSVVSAF